MKIESAPFILGDSAPTQFETRALRAALRKIELAEDLVDQLLACEPASEEIERVTRIRAQIHFISKIIREQLDR